MTTTRIKTSFCHLMAKPVSPFFKEIELDTKMSFMGATPGKILVFTTCPLNSEIVLSKH